MIEHRNEVGVEPLGDLRVGVGGEPHIVEIIQHDRDLDLWGVADDAVGGHPDHLGKGRRVEA